MIDMNHFARLVMSFEGKDLPIKNIPGPEGVRGRNSDNTLIKEKLGWAPSISLYDGIKVWYFWGVLSLFLRSGDSPSKMLFCLSFLSYACRCWSVSVFSTTLCAYSTCSLHVSPSLTPLSLTPPLRRRMRGSKSRWRRRWPRALPARRAWPPQR